MSRESDLRKMAGRLMMEASVADVASRLVRDAAPVVDIGLQKLTKVDAGLPKRQNAKTNPTSVSRRLRPRGLAIARLLAEGKSTSQIAQALGVSRQAIWKWSRQPQVESEVQRVHVELFRSSARKG